MWIFGIGSSVVFAALLRDELYDGLVLTLLVQKDRHTIISQAFAFTTFTDLGLNFKPAHIMQLICLARSDLLHQVWFKYLWNAKHYAQRSMKRAGCDNLIVKKYCWLICICLLSRDFFFTRLYFLSVFKFCWFMYLCMN